MIIFYIMVAKKKTSDDWGKCHEVYFTMGDGYEDSATVFSFSSAFHSGFVVISSVERPYVASSQPAP